jgi:hypothetical protein
MSETQGEVISRASGQATARSRTTRANAIASTVLVRHGNPSDRALRQGVKTQPAFLTLSRMLAWSLPRQQVFAPCLHSLGEYTRYWRRRENLLARQCPAPSSRDRVRNAG